MTPNERSFSSGYFLVKEGNQDAFLATWKEFAHWTRSHFKSAGRGAKLMQDIDNPRRYLVIGEWDSFEDIREWRNSREFQDTFARIRQLCERAEPMNLRIVVDLSSHTEGTPENETVKSNKNG